MLNVINSSQIPGQLRSLAALVLIIGQGKIDDLRALGFDIADSTAEQLAVLCPSLELDTQNLAFETTDELPTDLSDSLLTALLLCEREGERWDMSDQERLFERFSALAAALLDMGDPGRSMSLLKLTGQLLSVRPGLILPGKRVFGSREPKASVRATAQERLDSSQTVPLVRVRLFGDLEIEVGGNLLEHSQVQKGLVRILFCLLVLNLGKGLARTTAIDWIWPLRDHEKAVVGFYNLWYRLCNAFPMVNGVSPYFTNDERLLKADPRYFESDITEFERLSRQVFFERGSLEERFAAIDRLEQLYRNDVLAGSADHPRILAAQERYRGLLIDVLLSASKLHQNAGNNSMALWYARRAFDTDPKREEVYRALITAQEANGQRTEAMNTYLDCRRYLNEELGILPSKQTTALYQELILDGE